MVVEVHVHEGSFLEILGVPVVVNAPRVRQVAHHGVTLAHGEDLAALCVDLLQCRDLHRGVNRAVGLLHVLSFPQRDVLLLKVDTVEPAEG